MEAWIFKIVWMPIFIIVIMCASAVIGVMVKDTGWDVPFRWLCIIGLIAFIADKAVNK